MARKIADRYMVIETVKTGCIYHGPFKNFDAAYNWMQEQEEFAKKHYFNWTYAVRTLQSVPKPPKECQACLARGVRPFNPRGEFTCYECGGGFDAA